MRSSTITPMPPVRAWLSRAGNGFQMSKRRKSRNAVTSTGMLRGSGSRTTERSMPATSSMTITPGSLRPSARSTREPAQTPSTVTTASATTMRGRVRGRSQIATAVTRLPTVPDATGEYPAPNTLATTKASRSRMLSGLFGDELVAVHLDDVDVCEASRREPAVAEQHVPVDLGRLARGAPLERKGGIRARPVHQHGLSRAHERLLPRPGEGVLEILHLLGALGHHLGRHLVRHRRGGRALLHRVGEDPETIEARLLHE